MPELPEVETIVRTLRPHVEGLYLVKALEVKRPCVLPEGLPLSEAEGLRLDGVSRRGKLILMNLNTGEEGRIMHVVLHLRMTGSLLAQDREAPFAAARNGGEIHALPFRLCQNAGGTVHGTRALR